MPQWGGRLTNGTAGVGTCCAGGQTGSNTGCGTTGGTAGNGGLVPWVFNGAIVAVFVGRTHGELVHVGFTQHDRTRFFELAGNSGFVGGNEVVQNVGATGGFHTFGAEQVFVCQRDAGQGISVACRTAFVGCFGLFQRQFFCHRDEAVVFAVQLSDAVQIGLRQFDTGGLASGQGLALLG